MTPYLRLWQSSRSATCASGLTLRSLAVGATIAYVASVLGYALVRPRLGDRAGWMELLDDFEPWAYAPVPVLGIAGALLGSGSVAAAGAALAATFGLRWGHRFLRRRTPHEVTRSSSDLTMMTYNTLAWQREGRDLEAAIATANPDVVGLQEIGPNGAWHLVGTFADRYPYHFVADAANPSGAAVLSRFPLRDPVAFRASAQGHWWQRMVIETPAGPITYFNVHTKIPFIRKTRKKVAGLHVPLHFCAERRTDEVRKLVSMLQDIDGPVIVVGDFNMTERSVDHRLMSSRLRDAFQAVGKGFGLTFPVRGSAPSAFPAPLPLLRLDYVWHSEHFEPAWAYVGEPGHSDHHPIIAGLRWKEPASKASMGVPLAASAV